MPALTMDQLRAVISAFESMYPDYYGYTDFSEASSVISGTLKYLLFRNRDESFNKENAVVVATYRE